MKNSSKSAIIVGLFLVLFSTTYVSAETVKTDRSGGSKKSTQTISARDNRSDGCPPALVEWVQDDFENKYWNFGLTKFSGAREKQCMKSVKDYEEHLKKQKGQTPALAEAENLTKALAQRNPKITPNYSLDTCNKLSEGKDQVAKTRYYSAMTKIEAVNSTILDEIAHYDSLLEGDQKTSSLYCNPAYPFPEVAKKCQDYKAKLSTRECADRRQEQIDKYTFKTMKALEDLRELNKGKEECLKKHGTTTCTTSTDAYSGEFAYLNSTCESGDTSVCGRFDAGISIIHAKYPWIKGKTFSKFAGMARWGREKDPAKVAELYKKGIQAQIKEDRDLFVKQYEHNVENANCLTFSDSRGKSKCDFKELKRELSYIPNMKQPPVVGTGSAEIEMQKRDEAESCIIDNTEKRDKSKEQMQDTQFLAATVLVNAVPFIGMPAGRMLNGISALTKFKNFNVARGSLASAAAGGTLALGATEVYQACDKAGKEVLKSTEKNANERDTGLAKDNLCPASTSKFEENVEAYDDCVMNVLFASADVWPFVKALKMTERFINRADKELLALYKSPEQRKRIEEILEKNGKMSDPERKAAAEELLGRKLTPDEQDCVIAMHNIASGKVMKTAASTAAGKETYNQLDMMSKGLGGKRCGFSSTESALLTRAGITGSNITQAEIRKNIQRSIKIVLGRDPTPDEVNAIFNNLMNTKAQKEALERLGSPAAEKLNQIGNVTEEQRNNIRLSGETRSPKEQAVFDAAEAKKREDAAKLAAKPAEPAAAAKPPEPKIGTPEYYKALRQKEYESAVAKGSKAGQEASEKFIPNSLGRDPYYARGDSAVNPADSSAKIKAQKEIEAEARRLGINSDTHMQNSIQETQARAYRFRRELQEAEEQLKVLAEANRLDAAKIQEVSESIERKRAWFNAERKKCRGIISAWEQAGWNQGNLYRTYNPRTMKELCYD